MPDSTSKGVFRIEMVRGTIARRAAARHHVESRRTQSGAPRTTAFLQRGLMLPCPVVVAVTICRLCSTFILMMWKEQAVSFLPHRACVPAWLLQAASGARSAALQFRGAFHR